MSVFDLSQTLESINAGCERFDVTQVYPISGNINDAYVGTGQASGLSTFQFGDSVNWWSPSMSVFILKVKFVKNNTTGANQVIPVTDGVNYTDNFVSTLFTQIKTQINSRQLDIIDVPWIIDTALTYSNAKGNFLKTYASMSHIGESLMERIRNTAENSGVVEVAFRPPVSLFNAKLLPPGAQFRIDFNWASSAQLAFDKLAGDVTIGTTGTDASPTYNVQVQSFSMYKATLSPSRIIELPERGVIDLTPCISNQYFLNGSDNLKQNITLPSTTNRILVTIQDQNQTAGTYNGVSTTYGVGKGFNSATSFTNAVSASGATTNPFGAALQNAYLSLPELGVQMPQPTYQFDGTQDWTRAYADWCNICQGTVEQSEGSVPLGTFSIADGITINYVHTTVASSVFQAGNPANPQQYYISAVGASAPATTLYNQTCKYGYLGRAPGPILAFPVVRPENKSVNIGTLNLKFSTGVASIVATVLCSYSMALALEHTGNGLYSYTLVEGV